MSLNKCEGVKFICETHLSTIQCVYFWFIHNPIVELQSKNYLGIISGSTEKILRIISGSGSFQGHFGDHFGVGRSLLINAPGGRGSFQGRDHFGGCTNLPETVWKKMIFYFTLVRVVLRYFQNFGVDEPFTYERCMNCGSLPWQRKLSF